MVGFVEYTCRPFGAYILGIPDLAHRGILLRILGGSGQSTSTSILAKYSSGGPKESEKIKFCK